MSGPPATLASARSRCSCQAVRYSTVSSWRTSIAAELDRMEVITLVTVLLVVVATGGGVGERLANGVVVELETGTFERRRDGALTDEQPLVGELAERCPHGDTGQYQRGGAIDHAPECGGELGVGDRRRAGQVHRAGQRGV